MKVRIFKPTKSTMQSGKKNSAKWILEFIKTDKSKFVEPLMHRVSSTHMMSEVKLEFDSLKEAVDYSKAYDVEIIQPTKKTIKKKTYIAGS